LGGKVGIYLVLSDEEISRKFVQSLTDVGVENLGQYVSKSDRVGESVIAKVCVFITTELDGSVDRTMFAYDGLSADFSKVKLDLSLIKNYQVLYIEGYSFNEKSKDTIFKAIDFAKKNGVKVAFTPSSPHLVKQYMNDYNKIIDSSDILFTTLAEVNALYSEDSNDEDRINKLSKRVDVAIITDGKNGSMITSSKGSKKIQMPAAVVNTTDIVDTTGAGDGYAAGFLYRYTKGYSIEDSAKAGSIVAGEVIRDISARPSKSGIDNIIKNLK
jgi:sugar/nucleoside kinase (ribokinase family)